jgi:hypothetical protein
MRRGIGPLAVVAAGLGSALAFAQTARAQDRPQGQPFAVEYYYKARWGYASEFIELFKKNHYPVLQKEMELGRILQVTAVAPRYHATEDGRWDYRVTIVFRDAATHAEEFDVEPILRELYPDRETFDREEQRRFEILLAHWDVPLVSVDLSR